MKKLMYVLLLAIGVVLLAAPPVMAQEEKPFTLHGEVRYRGEQSSNTEDFDDDADDQSLYWPYRVRIAAEGKFGKNITAWIEFQNAGVSGNDTPFRTGSDEFNGSGVSAELYQGNITISQLWSDKFSVRIGRQELVAGNELLLGDLDFYAGISHDGLSGNWKFKKWNLMLWHTKATEDTVDTLDAAFLPPDQVNFFPSTGSDTVYFWGGYANWTVAKDHGIDVYLMTVQDRSVGANIQTVGGRYSHDVVGKNGLFWNVEVAAQTGQVAAGTPDVDASGRVIEGWLGYNFKSGKNTHRVYARLERATGDDAGSTDDFEGFVPLFGDFHNRAGRGDWFQLSQISTFLGPAPLGVAGGLNALGLGWTGWFGDKTEFGAQFWNYALDEDNGAPTGDDLGTAIDVWYGYNYSRNLNFVASLSQLSPDDALTGGAAGAPDDSVTRLYGQARFRF
jgi:alginate export protein